MTGHKEICSAIISFDTKHHFTPGQGPSLKIGRVRARSSSKDGCITYNETTRKARTTVFSGRGSKTEKVRQRRIRWQVQS